MNTKKMFKVFSILGFVLVLWSCRCVMAQELQSNFTAHLDGQQSVPAVNTIAAGEASFDVSQDGMRVSYTINVNDLSDVTMAHLHMGNAGATGDPVVWLYPSTHSPQEKTGITSGILEKGTFTADDLVGPLKGKSISDLETEIKGGNIYVNVHTKKYPAGEIRGQVK
jgi:hypothetical protein